MSMLSAVTTTPAPSHDDETPEERAAFLGSYISTWPRLTAERGRELSRLGAA